MHLKIATITCTHGIFLNSFPFIFIAVREIRGKVTLSLGLLSTPNPSFSDIGKVRKFY
jgi:hypothetical protein